MHRLRAPLLLLTLLLAGSFAAVSAQVGPERLYLPSLGVPPAVVVTSFRAVAVPNVGHYIVGEVQNQTAAAAYNVRVFADFIAVSTNTPATAEGSALLSYIAPGQKMPFEIDLTGRRPTAFTARVIGWETTPPATPIQVLTITRQDLEVSTLSGKTALIAVRNDSSTSVRGVRIAVSFLTANDRIVDVTSNSVNDVFGPGQTRSYRINVVDDITLELATKVVGFAQGEPFTPEPTPIPTPEPTPDPSRCHPSYPTVCIPPPPPDLNCSDIPHRRFIVIGSDPHNFDTDNDNIGCEG